MISHGSNIEETYQFSDESDLKIVKVSDFVVQKEKIERFIIFDYVFNKC